MPKRKMLENNNVKSTYVFTWRIENFSFCHKKKGEHIASPLFYVENLYGGQWYLMLYPKGISKLKDDANFLSCSLGWKPDDGVINTPAIAYSLEIANEAGGVLKCLKRKNRIFTKRAKVWGMMRFIKIDELAKNMDSWKEDVLVIRCRIKCDKLKKQTISGSEACTTIDVDRRFFEWDIKIPMLLRFSESIDFIFSDLYCFEIILMENFKISIQLNKLVSMFTRPIKFKIAIHNEKDNEITSKCAEHLFKIAETWQFPDIITKNVLEACKVDSHNCYFKLKCEVYISQGTTSISSIEKLTYITSACADFVPEDSSDSPMLSDFRNLYDDKKYCDITIKAGNNEFRIHKLILRMRSPVFEAMFDQDMLENHTHVVNVDDVDGETMKHFLEFLYTGKVNKMDYERAKHLMLVADKYQVPSLVEACASFLKSDLSVENVLDTISFADSLNCESLKTYALYFVKANVAQILITSYWTEWMKDNIILASDILFKLFTDLNAKYK